MTPEETAWLAGLFEGEGCAHVGGPNGTTINLTIQMTDEDVVRRAMSVAEAGNVIGPLGVAKPHHKPTFVWKVSRRDDVYRLALAMYAYLGVRRRAKLDEVIAVYKVRGPLAKTVHGTWARYKAGCRCDACRTARRKYYPKNARKRHLLAVVA